RSRASSWLRSSKRCRTRSSISARSTPESGSSITPVTTNSRTNTRPPSSTPSGRSNTGGISKASSAGSGTAKPSGGSVPCPCGACEGKGSGRGGGAPMAETLVNRPKAAATPQAGSRPDGGEMIIFPPVRQRPRAFRAARPAFATPASIFYVTTTGQLHKRNARGRAGATQPMNHDPVRWTSHAVSHVGTVRKINEDACLDLPAAGLWAVADGMGGHSSGDVASRSIVTALQALPATDSLAMLADHVEDALERVNTELRELAESASRHTIGSTVVVLAIRRRHALIAWAGDSRVYRLREGRLEQLTQDHAIVEDMVEIGLISREEALAHPQANRITRAVGAMEALYLDM